MGSNDRAAPVDSTARALAMVKAGWRQEWIDELLGDEAVERARICLVDRFDDHEVPPWVAQEVLRAALNEVP